MQILIPAAGLGRRLGPETSDKTKAMVKVNGKTLIEWCLDAAVSHPIDRILIIVGYEKDKLIDFLGTNYKGVEIVYIENPDYSTTNNIYSVFLAKDYLVEDDTLLIESDLLFEPKLLQMVIDHPSENLAIVDKYKAWMDGTVVKMNEDFSISHFVAKADFDYVQVDEYYKTVNIYKFSKSFLNDVYVPFLTAYATALGKNEYYEQVLKVVVDLDMKHLTALPLNGEKWCEIDDIQDLDNANIQFAEPEVRYELLSKRYGGYWRFDELIDFCYLVNPFFPPASLTNELNFSLHKLMQSYPSGERVQAMLGAQMFGIKESQIVVGNGAAELINTVTKFLGGNFGLYGPTFEEYTSRFENIDLRVPSAEGFRYGKEDVISLSKENDGVILINPDNPSGNFISYPEILEILEDFKNTGKHLVLDESFLDFAVGGFESSLLNTVDLDRFSNLIVIKSIGKGYGVGGLRLGVIVSSDANLVKNVKSGIPIWNINSVAEFYLQIIGKYSSQYKSSCKKLIEARVELFKQLQEIAYLKPFESQANYIFCKVLDKNAHQLAVILCDKYSILIKDCSGKSSVDGQYIRIAVRGSDDNQLLIKGLKQLA